MPVTAEDLDAAVSTTVTTLRPATGRDWSAPAGALEWDCWHTAEHLGDVLLSAAHLVAQPTTRYVRFMTNADKEAAAAEVLEFAEAGGRILAATVRTSPPRCGLAPSGMADPEGFAGMGCVEALVHGLDIAQGLGLTLDPRGGVHPRARPDVPARRGRPGRPRPVDGIAVHRSHRAARTPAGGADWRWHGAPLNEHG